MFIGIIVSALWSKAQDIHFSQFYMNPVYLNPALTGNFDGEWRFALNQRSQWRSVSRPYNTVGISAENKQGLLLPGLYHGINIFHDAAGDGNYRTIEVSLSTAYQMYLDKDSVHSITPGINISLNYRSIDFSKLNFDNQYNGYYFDPSLPQNETFTTSSHAGFNLSVGALYTYHPEKRKKITLGVGLFNIPQIKQSFYGDDGIRRDRRFMVHGRGTFKLKEKIDVQPAFFAQFQGKFKEVVFGTNVRYIMTDKKGEYIAPYAGIYFRNKDAVNITGGLYYNNWIAGISYDFNVSQLAPASHVRGGLEFAVQYILHLFKPKVIQYRVCPDYL